MNSSSSSDFSYSGTGGGHLDEFNKQWKVTDSFKANKLRVSSKEELRKKREAETARRNHCKTSNKSSGGSTTKTSDATSYLKSRRQKARDERRQNILGILDDNLDKLEGTCSPPSKSNHKSSVHTRGTAAVTTTSTTANTASSSPKSILKEDKSTHSRLRVLNPFRNKKSDANSKHDKLKPSKSGRRTTRRRKEQKEAMESVRQDKEKKSEMEGILEEVLRRYPKEKCRSFADHKEFAFAELAIQSNKNKEIQMDAEKFKGLRTMLEKHLVTTLGEDDNSVAESAKLEESSHQRQHVQPMDSQGSHGLPKQQTKNLSAPNSPSSSGRHFRNLHASSSSSPTKAPSSSSSPSSSPRRIRSVVPDPPSGSPRKSPGKERNRLASPASRTPKSTKSLTLPQTGNVSMKLAPFIEKDDHTSATEDDESTLVPVVKVLITDTNGQVGKYTGTICVNAGKPHGSGRLDYEDGGAYNGEWNQGRFEGYGRFMKPNGDIYEGTFLDNLKNGKGLYKYRDGKRVFEGRYVMGQRVEGKMTYGDGSVFQGQWHEGKRHGRGTYRFKDGSVFKGEFYKDVIHGVGQLVWPDGAKYIGEWNRGHRHGMGKEYTADGTLRYEGRWKDSVPVS